MMESKINEKVSNSNNVKDLKLKDIFKLSECTFEDKVLEGYPEAVKQQRRPYVLLHHHVFRVWALLARVGRQLDSGTLTPVVGLDDVDGLRQAREPRGGSRSVELFA